MKFEFNWLSCFFKKCFNMLKRLLYDGPWLKGQLAIVSLGLTNDWLQQYSKNQLFIKFPI